MSKEQAAKKLPESNPTANTSGETALPKFAMPDGLVRYTGDVLGFHDPETQGPIDGIPRGVKISDSKLDPKKPSSFVIFELMQPCLYTEGTGDDAVTLTAEKGQMVGVWTKGGMRAIRNMCGRRVVMIHTGEKKLKGRPAAQDPMKTYDFHVGPGAAKPIPIIEDTREKSVGEKSMFDLKTKPGREPGDDDDSDAAF